MGKVIAVINYKGGVGKTATSANLGAALHECGKKVLLIDLDGQANLTQSLDICPEPSKTIYEAIKGTLKYLPIYPNQDGLNIVPSCIDLAAAETELMTVIGREILLKALIDKIKGEYDYIIIDCPPSLSLLTLNALTAADSYIIPIQAQYLALTGMTRLLEVIAMVKERLNPALEMEGALITIYDNRKNFHQGSADLIKETFKDKVFKTIIRDNVQIGEATTSGRDIIHYAPKSNGATDYMNLAKEILKY